MESKYELNTPRIDILNTPEERDLLESKEEIWEKKIDRIEEDLEAEEREGEELVIELPREEEISELKEEISRELWGEEDKKKNKINLLK